MFNTNADICIQLKARQKDKLDKERLGQYINTQESRGSWEQIRHDEIGKVKLNTTHMRRDCQNKAGNTLRRRLRHSA